MMKIFERTIDASPEKPENMHMARSVTSSDVRAFVVRMADFPHQATDEEEALLDRLHTHVLENYIRVKATVRARHRNAIIRWLGCGRESQAARASGDAQQRLNDWIPEFLEFAARYIEREWFAQHKRREVEDARRRDKERLDSWCEMTHGQSGGDGRTPPIGRREFSGGTCEACAVKAMLFGPPGSFDIEERRAFREQLMSAPQFRSEAG